MWCAKCACVQCAVRVRAPASGKAEACGASAAGVRSRKMPAICSARRSDKKSACGGSSVEGSRRVPAAVQRRSARECAPAMPCFSGFSRVCVRRAVSDVVRVVAPVLAPFASVMSFLPNASHASARRVIFSRAACAVCVRRKLLSRWRGFRVMRLLIEDKRERMLAEKALH